MSKTLTTTTQKDEKGSKMKRPTYKMQRIKLADCKPHADAEAYSASTEDRAALSNSIGEAGILSPIAVVPDEDGRGWFVIDGIGRMNALIAAGETETEAQVFDLGDLSVAEFVVCKNAMMRKVTTGTRVMAYLKCHEREVLAAADRPLEEPHLARPEGPAQARPRTRHRLEGHGLPRGGGVMWCSMCPFLANCEDPAQLGGGCDCDGADDYGVDPIDDFDDMEDE